MDTARKQRRRDHAQTSEKVGGRGTTLEEREYTDRRIRQQEDARSDGGRAGYRPAHRSRSSAEFQDVDVIAGAPPGHRDDRLPDRGSVERGREYAEGRGRSRRGRSQGGGLERVIDDGLRRRPRQTVGERASAAPRDRVDGGRGDAEAVGGRV
jgi:hypothetical protein